MLDIYPSILSTHQSFNRDKKCSLLEFADYYRKEGRFNDVTIKSKDTSIPANRMVLSCFCSFFYHNFVPNRNDRDHDSVVNIPNIDGKLLELLVQYIYTGQICIDSDNVFDILSAAHYLELDEVKEFCFKFLENCMTPDNCITILITAKQYKNFTLRDKVYKHISDNYKAITKTPAFLNLERNELFFIVFHLKTRFYVENEVLCRSLLSWTKQDEETRKQEFFRLIQFVNVNQLSFWSIKVLLNESLIRKIPEYFGLLNIRMEFLETKTTELISVGGCHPGNCVKVIYYLPGKIRKVCPDLPIQSNNHRLLKLNNFVYCVGGRYDKEKRRRAAFRLNLKNTKKGWESMVAMKKKRCEPGAAVFDGKVVVCGGRKSAEAYDPELNKWEQLSSLKQKRNGNHLVASNGCLYAMGGYDGKTRLSSVERLNGLGQSWKSVSSMQTPRCWFAAVSFDDVIYVIGGRNHGFDALKSVEKYDCIADKWVYVSEMNIERWGHSACVAYNTIFVVGGVNDKSKSVKEVECYDISSNRWHIIKRIDNKLFGHSLITL